MKLIITAARSFATTAEQHAQPSVFKHKGVRLIVGGWTTFILENLILSHNREALVTALGAEKNYLLMYSTLSTMSCAAILVGFGRFGLGQGPKVAWRAAGLSRLRMFAFPLQAFAAMLFSQTLPDWSTQRMLSGGCPLDFSKKKNEVQGVERITRHTNLWALGVFGLGYAASAVYATEFAFGAFPILFTMIGGAHQDARHRVSGKLTEERDRLTSHVPF